jgi:hypothetical protein
VFIVGAVARLHNEDLTDLNEELRESLEMPIEDD